MCTCTVKIDHTYLSLFSLHVTPETVMTAMKSTGTRIYNKIAATILYSSSAYDLLWCQQSIRWCCQFSMWCHQFLMWCCQFLMWCDVVSLWCDVDSLLCEVTRFWCAGVVHWETTSGTCLHIQCLDTEWKQESLFYHYIVSVVDRKSVV